MYGAEKLDPMTLLRLILGAGSYCSHPIVYKRDPTENGGDVRGGMSRNLSMYRAKNVLRGGGGRAKGVSVTNSD